VSRSIAFRLLASVSLFGLPSAVLAQTPSGTTEAVPEEEADAGSEIIVTANKRAQNIQDVPLAITALTGDTLRDNNISEARDLFQRIPNISVASNASAGQLQLSIRGINFLSFSPISVQPVLAFVDDVVINSPQSSGLYTFDLDRVEVLRGPQNTLYGRNTTGGAVNFVTRKPRIGEEANGYLDVSYGRFDSINVNAAIGAPIGEKAAFRLAVQSLHTKGPWKNITTGDRQGDRDQTFLRGQFLLEPSEDLNIRLDIHGGKSNGGQRGFKGHGLYADSASLAPCADINTNNFSSSCVDFFDNPTIATPEVIQSDLRDDRDNIKALGGSITIRKDFASASLTSITAYESNTFDHWEDSDSIPIAFVNFRQHAKTRQWSQELRLASPDEGRFKWMIGGFGFWENVKFETAVPIALFDPTAAFSDSNKVDHDTEAYSAFVQADYEISNELTFSGGLRYVHEKKSGLANYQFTVGLDALDINNADAFRFDALRAYRLPQIQVYPKPFGKSWSMWGGKFGLQYKPTSVLLVYAHIARGAKAGQFTDAPDAIGNGGFFTPAEPEKVISYELGLKSELMDRMLIANFALFYNDYKDQQQQISYTNNLGNVVSTVVNVASSETYGVEVDMQLSPGGGWRIDASAAYLKSKTKADSLAALTGGSLAVPIGRSLTNAPKWTLGGGIRKEWEFGKDSKLSAGIDGQYTSSRNFDLLERAVDKVFVTDPSYFLLNATASFEFGEDQRYRVLVWGKNLTNELYFQNLQEFAIGTSIGFVGDPRSYGVTLGVSF
jgi:iron complex outermembrane receptor protein